MGVVEAKDVCPAVGDRVIIRSPVDMSGEEIPVKTKVDGRWHNVKGTVLEVQTNANRTLSTVGALANMVYVAFDLHWPDGRSRGPHRVWTFCHKVQTVP